MSSVADPTSRRLLRHVAEAQTSGRVPSLVAGVVREGSLVWSGGYGDVPGASPTRSTGSVPSPRP